MFKWLSLVSGITRAFWVVTVCVRPPAGAPPRLHRLLQQRKPPSFPMVFKKSFWSSLYQLALTYCDAPSQTWTATVERGAQVHNSCVSRSLKKVLLWCPAWSDLLPHTGINALLLGSLDVCFDLFSTRVSSAWDSLLCSLLGCVSAICWPSESILLALVKRLPLKHKLCLLPLWQSVTGTIICLLTLICLLTFL